MSFDVASIVFISNNGLLIFQLRENKPGIRNPGMITTWGGAVEKGESPIRAALREVKEETNLNPSQDDLEFFGKYPRDYKINGKQVVNHVYLLRSVDENNLKIYEGVGYELIKPGAKISNPKYTELTKKLITEISV